MPDITAMRSPDKQPQRRVVHTPTLSGVLRCQDRRCSRVYYGANVRPADVVFPKCWADRCGAEWWALKLGQGDTIVQLAREFGIHALDVADLYQIPYTLGHNAPLYLQLALEKHEAARYRQERRSALSMFRLLNLFPRNAA